MPSRPGERERSKTTRRLLAFGLTLVMGYASGLLTLGGCAGAPWPSNGKLPERVVERLTDCGKKGPTPLASTNYELAFTVHVTEDDQEARVDEVMLTNSTLHLPEIEACMTDALYGMRTPLEALALRRRTLVRDPAAPPPARAMLGQAELALFLEAAAVILVGYAAYTVVVQIVMDKRRTKPRPHPAQPETAEPPAPPLAAATAEPTATTAPTATPAPAGKSCTDMYVDCRDKGPTCNRKLSGKTMCAYCQDNCLADEPYKFRQCKECGFQ